MCLSKCDRGNIGIYEVVFVLSIEDFCTGQIEVIVAWFDGSLRAIGIPKLMDLFSVILIIITDIKISKVKFFSQRQFFFAAVALKHIWIVFTSSVTNHIFRKPLAFIWVIL